MGGGRRAAGGGEGDPPHAHVSGDMRVWRRCQGQDGADAGACSQIGATGSSKAGCDYGVQAGHSWQALDSFHQGSLDKRGR
jgi:hypothetical protein